MRLENGVMEGDEIWSGVNVLGKRWWDEWDDSSLDLDLGVDLQDNFDVQCDDAMLYLVEMKGGSILSWLCFLIYFV